ncbi:MAG: hypothetical protein ACODAD_07440, partial [Planctomycetota bacterium]
WHDMNPASNISLISAFISGYQRFWAFISGFRLWAFISGFRLRVKAWAFGFSTRNDQNIQFTPTQNRERMHLTPPPGSAPMGSYKPSGRIPRVHAGNGAPETDHGPL